MHCVSVRLAVALIAVFLGASAGAQGIAVTPGNPNDTDWITIRFQSDGLADGPAQPLCSLSDPVYRKVTIANNVITVEKFDEDGMVVGVPPIVRLPTHDVWAGRLLAGDYRVEIRCSSIAGVSTRYATGAFTVTSSYMTKTERRNPAANPPRPLANYSGHWTPADELGWGLIIQQVESRQVAVTLFTYGSDTRPVWYFCGGGRWESMFTYRSTCDRFQAGGFGTPIGGLAATGAGSVVLRFAENPTGAVGEERAGFGTLLENNLVADIVAEGRAISSKRFVRIR